MAKDQMIQATTEQVLGQCDHPSSNPLRIEVGDYITGHCRSLTTGKQWWRVYRKGAIDGLSDHATLVSAKIAIRRYAAADTRRMRAGA